ncbi:MAG: RNA polymerase sigma factor [Longimicrobiales bacterium]
MRHVQAGRTKGAAAERALIARAAAGDAAAMRDIYHLHAAAVMRITLSMIRDEMLAEDAAQEAWIKVFRGLASFRGGSALSTWIHRVAVNASLNLLRSRSRKAGRERSLAGLEELACVAAASPVLRIELERALAMLPPRMREVFVLHDVEGRTHREIADLLGIAEGYSKSHLFKARRRLRHLLEPDLPAAA